MRTFVVEFVLHDATKRFGWEFLNLEFGVSEREWDGNSDMSVALQDAIVERIVGNAFPKRAMPSIYSYRLVAINE